LVKDLSIKTIKLLGKKKKNTGEKLHDIVFGNDSFGYDTKSTGNKRKNLINWTASKFKISFVSKDVIKRMKRQPTEWEKIFTIHIPDKGINIQNT